MKTVAIFILIFLFVACVKKHEIAPQKALDVELPKVLYDTTKTVYVPDDSFGVWVNRISLNPRAAIGVHLSLRAMKIPGMTDLSGYHFFGRQKMGSCEHELSTIGFIYRGDSLRGVKDSGWVLATGRFYADSLKQFGRWPARLIPIFNIDNFSYTIQPVQKYVHSGNGDGACNH